MCWLGFSVVAVLGQIIVACRTLEVSHSGCTKMSQALKVSHLASLDLVANQKKRIKQSEKEGWRSCSRAKIVNPWTLRISPALRPVSKRIYELNVLCCELKFWIAYREVKNGGTGEINDSQKMKKL